MINMEEAVIREQIVYLLKGGGAHRSPKDVIAPILFEEAGRKPSGLAHSVWELAEHMRICQWDILEFTVNPGHASPDWPDGYWPKSHSPGDREMWTETKSAFFRELDQGTRGEPGSMFRRIIVPIDLEEESSWHKVLPVAIDYARHVEAELHVISVVPDHMLRMTVVAQLIPEDYEEKLIGDAQGRLSRLLETNVPKDIAVQQAVRLGSVYREIMRYARDTQADLIIMAAHRPELSDYLLGPNAAQVVRHSDCSVWTIRG